MSKQLTKFQSRDNASTLHRETLAVLREMYPLFDIRQEYTVEFLNECNRKVTLFFDLFIKELGIAFECNGVQHYKFNSFFHADKGAFENAKRNDDMKKRYCELNGIDLVEIAYNEKVSAGLLKSKIKEVIKKRKHSNVR